MLLPKFVIYTFQFGPIKLDSQLEMAITGLYNVSMRFQLPHDRYSATLPTKFYNLNVSQKVNLLC